MIKKKTRLTTPINKKRKYTTVSAKKGIAEMFETLYDNKRNKLNETEKE